MAHLVVPTPPVVDSAGVVDAHPLPRRGVHHAILVGETVHKVAGVIHTRGVSRSAVDNAISWPLTVYGHARESDAHPLSGRCVDPAD